MKTSNRQEHSNPVDTHFIFKWPHICLNSSTGICEINTQIWHVLQGHICMHQRARCAYLRVSRKVSVFRRSGWHVWYEGPEEVKLNTNWDYKNWPVFLPCDWGRWDWHLVTGNDKNWNVRTDNVINLLVLPVEILLTSWGRDTLSMSVLSIYLNVLALFPSYRMSSNMETLDLNPSPPGGLWVWKGWNARRGLGVAYERGDWRSTTRLGM